MHYIQCIQQVLEEGLKEMNVKHKAGLMALIASGAPLVMLPGATQYPLTAMTAICAGVVYVGMLSNEVS